LKRGRVERHHRDDQDHERQTEDQLERERQLERTLLILVVLLDVLVVHAHLNQAVQRGERHDEQAPHAVVGG
jgi:hypothetical protein